MRQNKKLIRRASGSFKTRQEKDAIDDAVKLAPEIGRKILKQPSLHIFLSPASAISNQISPRFLRIMRMFCSLTACVTNVKRYVKAFRMS